MAEEALINPDLLAWARRRAGLSVETLAKKMKKMPEDVVAWEHGTHRPSFRQAQTLAKRLRVPFGYLFLSRPPAEDLPVADFRTHGAAPEETPILLDLIHDAQWKQDWFRDHLRRHGATPLGFIGSADLSAKPAAVARNIRETLGWTDRLRAEARDCADHLRGLTRLCEDAGIWVMRRGIVGNDTRRRIPVRLFRGLALSDPYAPLILVNTQDAPWANIFTLAHELGHLWLGLDAIGDGLSTPSPAKTERFCNQVAATLLMPRDSFLDRWPTGTDPETAAQTTAGYFRVSQAACLYRAQRLKLIEESYLARYFERHSEKEAGPRDTERGGDFHVTLPARNGHRFTNSVARAAMSGELLWRDAGRLLNSQPGTVRKYYDKALK